MEHQADCQQQPTTTTDTDYQAFYTKRLKGLEQLKKRLVNRPPDSQSSATSDGDDKFEALKIKMLSLMEHDVTLMRQLLALNETVEKMKMDSELCYYEPEYDCDSLSQLSRQSSQSSLLTLCNEDIGGNAISQFLVNDDDADIPTKRITTADHPQYFSRQNSVLRIPIAPSHPTVNGRRRERIVLKRPGGIRSHSSTASSGASSASSSSSGCCRRSSTSISSSSVASVGGDDLPKGRPQLDDVYEGTGDLEPASQPARITEFVTCHESDSSIDSGIASEDRTPDVIPSGRNCRLISKELASEETTGEFDEEVFV